MMSTWHAQGRGETTDDSHDYPGRPAGNLPNVRRVLELLEGQPGAEEMRPYFLERLRDEHERARFFTVAFREGGAVLVDPNDDDPHQFEEQLLTSDDMGLLLLTPTSEEVLMASRSLASAMEAAKKRSGR